jgi:phosphoglycolate phosphatase
MPSKPSAAGSRLATAEAVFFDLDGTLVDSARDLAAACDRMCDALGLPHPGEDNVRLWIGNGVPRLIERTLAHCAARAGRAEPPFSEAKSAFDAAYTDTVGHYSCLFPGAREGLQKVQAAGKPMVCITNKPLAFTETLLQQFGIRDWFPLLLAGDNVVRKKPDPWPLLHAAEYVEVPIGTCLMVGDSRHDIAAAKNAGCPVVCVSYGYNHGEDIAQFGADAVIDSLAEL